TIAGYGCQCLGSVSVSFASAPAPVFARGKARGAKFGVPNKRRETPPRVKTGPALRVARQISPCGVAGLGKGVTNACVPRLAWRYLAQQRGLRRNGNRPWPVAIARVGARRHNVALFLCPYMLEGTARDSEARPVSW